MESARYAEDFIACVVMGWTIGWALSHARMIWRQRPIVVRDDDGRWRAPRPRPRPADGGEAL